MKRGFSVVGLMILASCSGSELASSQTTADRQPTMLPLYGWWSQTRGDHFTTANPAWMGEVGRNKQPDYVYYRDEGMVFSPSPLKPPSTNTLYSWYSPSRQDNFVTSNPVWAGSDGQIREPDYDFVRQEGFVFSDPVAGTSPLQSFWDDSTGDNFTTSNPQWTGGTNEGLTRGSYALVRTEGFVLPGAKTSSDLLAEFGWKKTEVKGTTPIVTLLIQYSDVQFRSPHTVDYYRKLITGNAFPSLLAYFNVQSLGKFRLVAGPVVGPVILPDDPSTPVDERTFNCATNRSFDFNSDGTSEQPCPGSAENNDVKIMNYLQSLSSFDFTTYDRNRDGTITTDELILFVIGAEPATATTTYPVVYPTGGQKRLVQTRLQDSSISLSINAMFCGEGVGFATLAHESAHAIMDTVDLYGAGVNGGGRLNNGASIMSGTASSTEGLISTWHLDPYHKIRAGWLEPTVINISESMPGGSAVLYHVEDQRYRPLIFFDRRRGTKEFLILEFRNRALPYTPYDKDGLNAGLAVWYFKLDNQFRPQIIPGVIYAGPDGVLNSRVIGDDQVLTDRATGKQYIAQGPNDIVESTLGGDDAMGWDVAGYYLGAPNQTRGSGRYYTHSDGMIQINWPGSTDTNLRLRTATVVSTAPNLLIEWTYSGGRFLPRLDRIASPIKVSPGASIVIEGNFGLTDSNRQLYLERDGSRIPVPVSAWSDDKIIARVPTSAALGAYQLYVSSPTVGMSKAHAVSKSNALAVLLEP